MNLIPRFSVAIVLSAGALLAASSFAADCCDDATSAGVCTIKAFRHLKPAQVGFFSVPLTCPADPEIGCGSQSKPLLTEVEKRLPGSQAWLNRTGTVVAIVWSGHSSVRSEAKTVETLFQEQGIHPRPLKGKQGKKQFADFTSGSSWYRAGEVDELSAEKAGYLLHVGLAEFGIEFNWKIQGRPFCTTGSPTSCGASSRARLRATRREMR